MRTLEPYYATDRRIYWDAPCSDMQKEIDTMGALSTRLKQLDPTASCTYFPVEGKYMVFVGFSIDPKLHRSAPKEVTGHFHSCKQQALIEAITVLENA